MADKIPAYPYLLPILLPLPATTPTPSPYLLLPLLLPLPPTTPTPPLTYYYPYPSPYLLLPLLLPLPTPYSPGAWSEVTSMVTYVMMTNYFAPTWYFAQNESVTACTDTLLPEYETYLHVYCLQVVLRQVTLIYRTL